MTRYRLILEMACVAFITFALLTYFKDGSAFSTFQTRDLARAGQVTHGALILWGSETTGGGNLPGGFYYWLMSIPLLMGLGWVGVWYLMIVLDAAAAAVLWTFLRQWGVVSASFGLLFFLSSTTHTSLLTSFWNPSFLPFFLMCGLAGLTFSFTDPKRAEVAWLWTCACLGLILQLHLAPSPLLGAAIFMQVMGRRLGLTPLPQRIWWRGVGVLVLTLCPYLIWLVAAKFGISIGEMPPLSSGRLRDSLGAVMQNPSSVGRLGAGLGSAVTRGFLVTKQLLPTPAWFLLIIGIVFMPKKIERPWFEPKQRVLLICLVFSILSAAFFYWLPFGSRYALTFIICALLLVATFADRWLWQPKDLRRIGIGAAAPLAWSLYIAYCVLTGDAGHEPWRFQAVAFVGIAALSGLIWRRDPLMSGPKMALVAAALFSLLWTPFERTPGKQIVGRIPNNKEVAGAARFIFNRTGWDFDQARRKIHFLVIHREADIEPVYRETIGHLQFHPNSAPPDGFFILKVLDLDELDPGRKLRDILLARHPAKELAEDLLSGAIEILDHQVTGRLLVTSFRWTDASRRLESFQNLGFAHEASTDSEILKQVDANRDGVETLADKDFLFHWNDCPTEPYGVAGMRVQIKSGVLRAEIVGRALSQASPWIFPYCTQGLLKPYVELQCGASKEKFVVAQSIGFNLVEPPIAAETFLTPFAREFPIHCRGPITRVEAGRDRAMVANNGSLSYPSLAPLFVNVQ